MIHRSLRAEGLVRAGRRSLARAVVCGIAATAVFVGVSTSEASAAISYQVYDHPDGALGGNYMMRLDHWDTFTANAEGTAVYFTFDPLESDNSARIHGTVKHNQGGGFYTLDATLRSVKLTDGGPGENWYGDNDRYEVYDDMMDDLLNNSNAESYNYENFTWDLDRIYFRFIDVGLTHLQGPDSFDGQELWDEYPNNHSKKFFIQKNHRTDDDVLAGAGWLEHAPDHGRYGTSDFLLTFDEGRWTPPSGTPSVMEPASLALMSVGLFGIGATYHRRFRKGQVRPATN